MSHGTMSAGNGGGMADTDSKTADKSQSFSLSGKMPKWLLQTWTKIVVAVLMTAGIMGSSSRVILGDVRAIANAAAEEAMRRADAPSRAEVKNIAREQAEAIAASVMATHERWLDQKFATQAERDKAIAEQLGTVARQLEKMQDTLRRPIAAPRPKAVNQ